MKAARERIDKLASFSIDSKEIELGQILGRGSFGVVHQGKCRGKAVAVKKLHEQSLSQDALTDFANEIEIMTKIHHPHIILCLGACIEPGKLMIVTELMNGDLEQVISNPSHQHISLIARLRMAKDAALGINWLHCSEPMIIHRDVKPSNFLIDENYRVVVADFGLSEGIKKGASKWDPTGCFKGSLTFTSPEILKGAEFDESSDVYSFGIVLWGLYSRQLNPYPELEEIANQDFVDKIVYDKYRPKIDEKCPPKLRSLMEKCWAADVKERPDFKEIISSLEDLILELSISDKEGREWWKKKLFRQRKDTVERIYAKILRLSCYSPTIKRCSAFTSIVLWFATHR
jgi:serine/threonine protein kinase